ncbi:hypothetical protein [Photorhabdus sp. RW14-46]|uniref:hypothetical protein n=1 Tax=Photorhabdus sp. RW14-46 TaxID=2100168 RepID=UPI0013F49589|nr:hypothetical protein [Photorhabdus sp. RW14-46]
MEDKLYFSFAAGYLVCFQCLQSAVLGIFGFIGCLHGRVNSAAYCTGQRQRQT